MNSIKRLLLGFFLFAVGCASVPDINHIPEIVLGEPSFFPTIAAHTDAPILAGNRVELLFNGEQIFPAMLKAIRSARKSITYSQYLYKDGPIAHKLAEALAERCRGGVQVRILIDDHGGSEIPRRYPSGGGSPAAKWNGSGASDYFNSSRHGSC
jgi:phosphatidylserine/phosphatidylglycerophosphate/cardiolipin synthase-like enzyme